MPTTSFDKESIKQSIIGKLQRYNGRTVAEATPQQIYKARRVHGARSDHAEMDDRP